MFRYTRILLSLFFGLTLAACQATVQPPPEVSAPEVLLSSLPKTDLRTGLFIHPTARRYMIMESWAQFQVGQSLERRLNEYLPQVFAGVQPLATFPPSAETAAQLDAIIVLDRPEGNFQTLSTFNHKMNLRAEFSLYTPDGQKVAVLTPSSSAELYMGSLNPADNIQKSYEAADFIGQGVVLNFLRDMPIARLSEAVEAYYSGGGVPTVKQARAPIRKRPPTLSGEPIAINFAKGAQRPDDIAVIIGNANYKKLAQDIPNVPPAYGDAEGMRLYVTQALGIRDGNIIDLRDATGAQMQRIFGNSENARGQLYDWVRPGRSQVFVYFAGHGAPGAQDGTPYLVPSDADGARIQLNGYPLSVLYRNLDALPATNVTVVLEACFSGVSQSGTVISKASPIFLKLKTPTVPEKLTVISAGAPDQLASWDQDTKHSLFTSYFLKGMAGAADKKPYGDKNGTVSYTELDAYLSETLTYYARRYYGRDQKAQFINAQ